MQIRVNPSSLSYVHPPSVNYEKFGWRFDVAHKTGFSQRNDVALHERTDTNGLHVANTYRLLAWYLSLCHTARKNYLSQYMYMLLSFAFLKLIASLLVQAKRFW